MEKKSGFDAMLLLGVELERDDQPTDELRARCIAAAEAYRQGLSKRIVVCGGRLPEHTISEADVMVRLLEENGVPVSAVIKENQSQDTMENMRFAARLLGGAKGKRVLIVTSDYHLRRAVMTARRVGFKAKGYAAELENNEKWKRKRNKEFAYMFDLVMGWQDEGKSRPAWTYRLFDTVFVRKNTKM